VFQDWNDNYVQYMLAIWEGPYLDEKQLLKLSLGLWRFFHLNVSTTFPSQFLMLVHISYGAGIHKATASPSSKLHLARRQLALGQLLSATGAPAPNL